MAYYFTTFFVYSFIGFILETAFALVTRGRLENRKTMYFLPLCPVYGVGALMLMIMLEPFRFSPIIVFVGGMIVGSVAEYLYAFFCMRFFNVWLWNYSADRFNCRGFICLTFTALWGVLAIAFIYLISPALSDLIRNFPSYVTLPLAAIFTLDCAMTYKMLRRIGLGAVDSAYNCPVITRAK